MTSFDFLRSLQELGTCTLSAVSNDTNTTYVGEHDNGTGGDTIWDDEEDLLSNDGNLTQTRIDDDDECRDGGEMQHESNEGEGGVEEGEEGVDDEDDERNDTIAKLENIALSIMSQLTFAMTQIARNAQEVRSAPDPSLRTNGEPPLIALELVNRRKTVHVGDMEETTHIRTVAFPGRRKGSGAKNLAQLLRVVSTAHEALVNSRPMTKRDLFYRDVPLFKTQAVVDGLVDDLAATLGVSRSNLNIRASAKGLFCGSGLTIRLQQWEKTRGKDTEATLIPLGEDILGLKLSKNVSWLLIVEKDAVFQTLCKAGLTRHPDLNGHGILITGKGYPDIATRQLVKTLSDQLPEHFPVLILVDADPYGIDIASVYKFGSSALRHEQDGLAAHRVDWIGVSCHDLERMNLDKDALIPITQCDHKKAISMLRNRPHMPTRWRRELMRMLHTRRKAEIEILSTVPAVNQSSTRSFDTDTDFGAHGMTNVAKQEGNPLVQYLIDKINFHVEKS